jgi:polyphosphate kinase
MKTQFIQRDISWLSFNARVLQEANDPTVPLSQRIRFLGIFSNNSDEFFRVRVATLKRMIELRNWHKKINIYMEQDPQHILEEIQTIVLQQQNEFNRIWAGILKELKKEKVLLLDEKHLSREQKEFVTRYFEEEVRSNIIPLMIESLPQMPYLRDKSIYLGVVMKKKQSAYRNKFALIEIPTQTQGRFIQLPAASGQQSIILLEDVIRFNLPQIFSYFGYENFESYLFKVTKDAELDIDNDVSTTFVEKIEKGLKNRRKGKPVRFVYDKEMDAALLEYLIRRLSLGKKSNIIPGGRIHNFRHFMDFPPVLRESGVRRTQSFIHPDLAKSLRVTDVIVKKDVLLHFPYHSFNSLIDLLRESAMDPEVTCIKITAYRLASQSKVIHALINAARNGKEVVVMLELKARFDEENNLEWKKVLEEEGVKVLLGVPNMKIHAKLGIIKKRSGNKTIQYGFVSTGNLHEKTARVYGDHCLLTANRTLLVCPLKMRKELQVLIGKEIKQAKLGKPASIILKLNSLSDQALISSLHEAAQAGVNIQLIIRGIYCPIIGPKKQAVLLNAISIVDEFLEHARVMIFHNQGQEKVFISSADWMVRNLDHRVEAAIPILNPDLARELKEIIHIQLRDNVKARMLDAQLTNNYVSSKGKRPIRSQVEIYKYLSRKNQTVS